YEAVKLHFNFARICDPAIDPVGVDTGRAQCRFRHDSKGATYSQYHREKAFHPIPVSTCNAKNGPKDKCWSVAQMHDRSTPPAKTRMIIAKRDHLSLLRENGPYCPSQLSNPLAMNDAYVEYPAFSASSEVIRDQLPYFARLKRVQIQNTIDWKLDRLIHFP